MSERLPDTSTTAGILEARASYARERLDRLHARLLTLKSLADVKDICVYATGSYGRLEASSFSDLDLFFIQIAAQSEQIGRIEKTLLDADIIRLACELGFPEFSGDGVYLRVHQLDEIEKHLGAPADDFNNHFTARLLLLLESRPLYGDAVYNAALRRLIEAYYRDYQDHERDFRPVFLANDIVRFWKTLCLNYEHRRNSSDTDPKTRAKHHVKNLKLKFSRMLTCYSALIWIAARPTGPGPEEVFEMVKMTPLDRLRAVRAVDSTAATLVDTALSQYAQFLQTVGRAENEVIEWISSPSNRDQAFENGRQFGEQICSLILHLGKDKPFLRYLLV